MTRLVWNKAGERFYETGVDMGVLFLDDQPGVAWNGLTSVTEEPVGGEPRPFYIDGIKYANVSSAEEYAATLEAFSSPDMFAACDGSREIYPGLTITHQPRKPFGLAYRSLIGNDIDGQDHGYKLHLVYNALAGPASRTAQTISDSPEPSRLSWGITAKPPRLTGFRPTAHLVVDSRKTPAAVMTALEDLLYGLEFVDPRLPTQQEVVELFGATP